MIPQAPDYIRTLIPYIPGKPIAETEREFKIRHVIKLASNENPLGPSPKAIQAIQRVLKESNRYPDGSAYLLKQALASHLRISSENLILGNGSNEVIELLIRAYCIPGESIVTSKSAFIAYRISAQTHGVKTLETDMTKNLCFNLEAMGEAVRKNAHVRIVFIANPNNPTGTYVTKTALLKFLKKVMALRARDILVVLDYAYWEYVTASNLPDPMLLLKEFENLVILRTFSKIYGLAGLRIGYGMGHPKIISILERMRQPFNLNSLALTAAAAALKDRAFVARSRKVNQEGMQFFEKHLLSLGIPFHESQGNFLLVQVKKGLGMTGQEVYQASLKAGVIFRPVDNYGFSEFLRISVGSRAENHLAIQTLSKLKSEREERRGH